MKARPSILTLTPSAVGKVQELMAARDVPAVGLRISIQTKGCSGLAYALDYIQEPCEGDESVHVEGVALYIDPQAILFLLGTTMDYVDDPIAPGFQFNNPNEKGRCGCGESFYA